MHFFPPRISSSVAELSDDDYHVVETYIGTINGINLIIIIVNIVFLVV